MSLLQKVSSTEVMDTLSLLLKDSRQIYEIKLKSQTWLQPKWT